jgi:hypothetical protein
MQDKSTVAHQLAEAHCRVEPSITRVVRLVSANEEDSREPIKLLEVNPETSPSGIVPIAFGPDNPSVPYPSIVVEVTEEEFGEIQTGALPLPEGWQLGHTLFSAA